MKLKQEWSSTLGYITATKERWDKWCPGDFVYSTLPHVDQRGRHMFGMVIAVSDVEPRISVLWSKLGPT